MHPAGPIGPEQSGKKRMCSPLPCVKGVVPVSLHSIILHPFSKYHGAPMIRAKPGLGSEDTVVNKVGSSPPLSAAESGEEARGGSVQRRCGVRGGGGTVRALRRAPHPGSWSK